MTATYEIRLIIDRIEDKYTAKWIDSGGQISHPFDITIPLGVDDTEELRWYLEEFIYFPGPGDYKRAEVIDSRLIDWGHKLFKSVFGRSDEYVVYQNLIDKRRDGYSCFITLGSNDPTVLQQPWEIMRNEKGPLALQDITFRRQLEGAKPSSFMKLNLPIRILLIVSRPYDLNFLDPESSIGFIRKAFENLYDFVDIEFCYPPTIKRLEEILSSVRNTEKHFHIIHFDGHGVFKLFSDKGALAFEDDNHEADYVTGTHLGDMLAGLDVPLIVLEACQGAHLSNKSVFNSLAPALLESGVGNVIAFSHSAHIDAACLLVQNFYRELASGKTIGKSLDQARRAMHANHLRIVNVNLSGDDENKPKKVELADWFVPQLYQVGDDISLFSADDKQRNTSKVIVTIMLDMKDYNSATQNLLQFGLAKFLDTSPDSVTLSRADKGSVKVTIELPVSSADKLLDTFYSNKDKLIQNLNLEVIKVARVFNTPPPSSHGFFGRAKEILELEQIFDNNFAAVISGMGGMGKTALAREAAVMWLRTGRFDQIVFVSFEQKAEGLFIAQMIGRAFEGDDFGRRSSDENDPEGQRQAAVRLFHENRALVVWDNFESTLEIYQNNSSLSETGGGSGVKENEFTTYSPVDRAELQRLYHDLTFGKPASRLLVTCRPQETGLSGIKEYLLDGLNRSDSLQLLDALLEMRGISTERPGYDRRGMDSLLDLLGDHPLSIELVAPHLKELTPAEIRADFGGLLEKFANPDAREDRNKGLRASLEFSRRRLSKPGQEMLPWLAWFEGGVFEKFLLMFTDLQPDAWNPIRTELEATALLKVEALEPFNTPYLRFHPTLGYAARPDEVPDPEAAAGRFIGLYLQVMKLANSLLRGQQPAAGMALMEREEANFRRALQSAFARGLRGEMQSLADTLRDYLERAGRNRERDALTAWVRDRLPDDVLDDAACGSIRDHAMTLLSQGQAQAAVEMVQTLLARLLSTGLADGSDPAFQIAVTYQYLGRIFETANRPDLSLEPLREAVARFEQLPGDSVRDNLSAALGDLANAYRQLSKFDEALKVAEHGLEIDHERGNNREVATSLGQIATILSDAHRYPEAEVRYAEAMQAAQVAGDLALQSVLLQRQAFLHREQGNYPRAVDMFKQAIALFQRANDIVNEMRTCDLLATAERQRGELDAAEAWYGRARQLAGQLHDRYQVAITAQNLGILYQIRAKALAENDPSRRTWLDKAVASVQESLEIKLERKDQTNAAASYFQLGVLHQMRGDLNAAEQNALQALAIHEPLDHPDLFKDYGNLANIARAHGDEKSAAEWQVKYETKRAEIKRRERGEGTSAPRVDEKLIKFLTELAQVSYSVRAQKAAISPDLAEALAQLHDAQPPFNEIGAFLQVAASGQALHPIPSGLPKQIELLLESLKEAIEELER